LDSLLAGVLAAVIGGRIGFVWANWSYFQERPDEIVLAWQGGLSYYGALVFGLITLWVWSGRRGFSFTKYAALMMPGLALAHVFGWLACWLEGCGYGRESALASLSFLSSDLPDSFGVFAVRYQTQLLGFALSLVIFLLIWWIDRRMADGWLFWLALFLLSSVQGLVTLFRGDPVPVFGPFRLDTWLNIGLVTISLFKMGFILWHGSKSQGGFSD
jgi:phosphatidylglycerol:prolipoprotein diacylglycerol transferase